MASGVRSCDNCGSGLRAFDRGHVVGGRLVQAWTNKSAAVKTGDKNAPKGANTLALLLGENGLSHHKKRPNAGLCHCIN